MSNYVADNYYYLIVNSHSKEKHTLKKYREVNEFLKDNDWLFISPMFFQGFELTSFHKLIPQKENHKEKILKIITNKFYDLRITASFTEGYCARCIHISPFLQSIEHSLILAFQRDYEGALKTIIPIIEGVIRKYLVDEKGAVMHKIQFQTIRTSFGLLKEDMVTNYRQHLHTYKDQNNQPALFSEKQLDDLIAFEQEYLDIWFSFATEFVDNSFYLKTTENKITNQVNRHSILHELGEGFDYNFENYIKVYFLLQFLTWAFLKKENKSLFDDMDIYRCLEKVAAYDSLIKMAEESSHHKHVLYKSFDNYKSDTLTWALPEVKIFDLPQNYSASKKIFQGLMKHLWRKVTSK